MRHEPHKLVEGCLIAGTAMRARAGYIYIRCGCHPGEGWGVARRSGAVGVCTRVIGAASCNLRCCCAAPRTPCLTPAAVASLCTSGWR
jgi:hypothetical protein